MAASATDGSAANADEEREWDRLDGNQLHTALSAAVNAEDYGRAQRELHLLIVLHLMPCSCNSRCSRLASARPERLVITVRANMECRQPTLSTLSNARSMSLCV